MKINSKLKALEWSQQTPHYKSLWGIFPDAQGQLTDLTEGLIWPNLAPIQTFMVVLVTCKNEEDLIKNEGARVVTTLVIDFSDAQGQLTPKTVMEPCQNSNSSKLLW